MLYLQNKGEIERGALSLLGASTKSGDQIGKFGSGFKYALATLIREGIDFKIYSGLTEIIITTEIERFRNTEFRVLVIDGVRTSITTNTGPEWTVRDAIREIWSNAIDEGDGKKTIAQAIELSPGTTTVAISTEHRTVKAILTSWNLFFVHDVEPLAKTPYGRILAQSTTNYFRRGVWICEDREMPGQFSYDFHDIKLPESRKIKSMATTYEVFRVLECCDDVRVFRQLLTNLDRKTMEWYTMNYYGTVAGVGANALQRAFYESWDFVGNKKNKDSVAKIAGTRRVLWLDDWFLSIFVRLGIKKIETEVSYDDVYEVLDWPIGYQEQLDPLLKKLADCGINYEPFNIVYAKVRDIDVEMIAMADLKQKRCVLTDRAFEAHPDMLAKALVEEWTHLEHNVNDCTRDQQHVYLNLIVDMMKRIK